MDNRITASGITMDATPEQVAKRLAKYWSTYNDQPGVAEYGEKTVINDALYGIGIALSDEYLCADGFAKFKVDLKQYLDGCA
ncbi:hypothetical protein [Marinobacterium litorale]|uniref:hypothetical protein n=1 Tax=Marinobacterium litorale TaxID=404770 RepID=UPI00040902D9|nr:hypothetical protein [Marinobacterium litorale]